jgi:ATP-dependent 26S proteasome regulatory subunit
MHSSLASFEHNLSDLIRARFPIVHVVTLEEDRALKAVLKVAETLDYTPHVWSVTRGLVEPARGDQPAGRGKLSYDDFRAAIDRCEKIAQTGGNSLFVFLDPHPFISEKAAEAVYRRRLREFSIAIRTRGYGATCVIVAPSFNVAHELEKEVALLDFPLPDRAFVRTFVEGFLTRVSKNKKVRLDSEPGLVQALTDASIGLTMAEIENCLAKALVDDFVIDISDIGFIFEEKKQIIRKSGVLEYIETRDLGLDDIGGLEALKRWLRTRRLAFSPEAADYGIPNPKGVLITGIPGCGKSLSAKCVASAWRMPLVKLDMGKVFSMWVGSSEENIRNALKTCEAIAPCVVWVDEIEKGVAYSARNIGDSGTSMRVFGTLLTWMQEKTSPVFLFATANDIEALPAEFLRKGRFDDIFFVDLPNEAERRAILEIHIRRHKHDPAAYDLDRLVEMSGEQHFGPETVLSGAEIEAWVTEAMIAAFARRQVTHRLDDDLSMADFEATLDRIVPLSRLRAEQFARMREWAAARAVNASDHPAPPQRTGRRIDLRELVGTAPSR